MASENLALTVRPTAKAPGQRLLIDTGKLSVRRVTKSEEAIMSALKTLAPTERSVLATLADSLQAKKRKRASDAESSVQ